jgi:spermidine/putrescine transport system permease protein
MIARGFSLIYIALAVVFIFLPVGVLVLFSFQGGRLPMPPFDGPSLDWYAKALQNDTLMQSLGASVLVGAVSAGLATTMGFLAAYGVARHATGWRHTIEMAMLVPASISYLIVGLGLLVFLGRIGLGPSLPAIVIGHTVITLPIAFSLILSQMDSGLIRAERAAQDLGAPEWKAVLLVTAPMLWAPILAAFCICFSLSWDEFIIAFLLSRFEVTLPVAIWASLRAGLNPMINAMGTLMFLMSLGVFLAVTLATMRGGFGRQQAEAGT